VEEEGRGWGIAYVSTLTVVLEVWGYVTARRGEEDVLFRVYV
jgi:hypothetical protein